LRVSEIEGTKKQMQSLPDRQPHAMDSDIQSSDANYQLEDLIDNGLRKAAPDHFSVGGRPIPSPGSPISTADSIRFYPGNEAKDEGTAQEPESEFARQLRLLDSAPVANYTPIVEEAEPALKCSCEKFGRDLSAAGLICETCQSAGWMHYLQCPDSFGVLEYGTIQDARLRESCSFCQMVWLAVEQEWKEDGWTTESENAKTNCSIMKEAIEYVPAGTGRENKWINEGWVFRLRIKLEDEPEPVKKRQETRKRMGVPQRQYIFLFCWIKGEDYFWRIFHPSMKLRVRHSLRES
jgi:hypothetical protein